MLPMGGPRQRGGIRFHLFGFPVRIDWSFFLIVAFIGFGNQAPLGHTIALGAVVGVSVLVHELGHAFAARTLGAKPVIELYAMGGLTMFQTPRQPTRAESIGVSLVGPFAGFALGGLVVASRHMGLEPSGDLARFTILVAEYANLVWGAVNLLPLLPLDGGNVMRNLLPGTPAERDRRAGAVSLVLAVGGIVVALMYGYVFAALLLGWVAFTNLMLVKSAAADAGAEPGADAGAGRGGPVLGRRLGGPGAVAALDPLLHRLAGGDTTVLAEIHHRLVNVPDPAIRSAAKAFTVEQLLVQWRPVEARQALDHLPGQVPPALYALVGLVQGDGDAAYATLDELAHRDPSPGNVRYALLGRVLLRQAGLVPGVVAAMPPSAVTFPVLRELQYLAHTFGDVVGAALVGELAVGRFGAEPATLYNIACSWARAGAADRAVAALDRAVAAGWRDAGQLDRDPDLATVRGTPGFVALRTRLAGV